LKWPLLKCISENFQRAIRITIEDFVKRASMHVFMYVLMYVLYTYVCIYVYLYIYVCTYVGR